MTTRSNEVAVTLTGKDRLSPVLQKARKNMGRMQSSVVSMTSSMGAMSTATSGILGPMGGLVGTMGVLGLAVTGVGLGLSIGINRFKAWREEQKKVSQATENLRNKLMLSGFSASAATSSVDELRGSLSRLAFQTLPGLDFEMRGFIINMDKATSSRFDEFVTLLTNKGVSATQAMTAVGDAIQGNFGPITKLMVQPINSFEDFVRVMKVLRVGSLEITDEVITNLRNLADASTLSSDEQTEALLDVGRTFAENEAVIGAILSSLTDKERLALKSFLEGKRDQAKELGVYEGLYGSNIDVILGHVDRAITAEGDQTTGLRREIDDRIVEIQRIDPVMAEEFQKIADRNAEDPWALASLKIQLMLFIQEVTAEANGLVGFLDTVANRARDRLASIRSSAAAARIAAAVPTIEQQTRDLTEFEMSSGRALHLPVQRPTPGTVPQRFQHGAVVTRPTIARIGEIPEFVAPLSRLPSLLEGMGGPRIIHIGPIYLGDRLIIRDLVIDVLNDEVSLREPSLGLG